MTDKQILQKAIEKAVENGFDFYLENAIHRGLLDDLESLPKYHSVIFSHNFAKAFWGFIDFEIHLRIMVLKKEPLKYLEKFL